MMNKFKDSSQKYAKISVGQFILILIFFGGVVVWSSPIEILRSLERQTAVVIGSSLNRAQPPKKEAPTCTPERDKQEAAKCVEKSR